MLDSPPEALKQLPAPVRVGSGTPRERLHARKPPHEARPHVNTTGASTTAGPRPVRAPRGTEISCRGWQQEAALRMLMNNLDPGGRRGAGRAGRLRRHRQGGARLGELRRDRRARCAASRTTRRCSCRAASPSASSQTHDDGAARAHRQRQPRARLGELGRVPAAGGAGPHHVRADDRRHLDLHRHAGHPAGHVPDVRRRRPEALRRSTRRPARADRRPRRHGRRTAAGRHHGGRRGALRRGRPAPHRAPSRDRLPRRRDRVARRGAASRRRGRQGEAAALSIGLLRQRRRRATRSSCAAASHPTSSPTRPRRTTPSTATCPTA